MAKRRIGVSMVGLAHQRTSGLERYGVDLINSLRHEAHDDWEIVPFVHSWAAGILGGDCVVVPSHLPRPVALEAWLPLAAKKSRVKLMHGTGFGIPPQVPCPFTLTVQDLISWELPDTITRGNRYYFRSMMERAIRGKRLAGAVATTRSTAEAFVSRFDVGVPVSVARIGLAEWWQTQQPGGPWGRNGPLRLLTVGTLEPRKGLHRIARACELLDDAGISYEWRLAGRAGWGAMDVPPQLEVLGRVSDEELREEYDRADVLVSASSQEGFNLPALEGLSRGCGLVLSDVPVHRELFSPFASLFPLGDEDALGRELIRTQRPDSARRQAAKRHSGLFSWRESSQSIFELWDKVL